MKKLLIIPLFAFLFGVGCNAKPATVVEKNPENTWYLTFENGDSWYPMEIYFLDEVDFGVIPERSVLPRKNRALVQNVYEPALPEEVIAVDGVKYSQNPNWKIVDVAVYPEQASMPDGVRIEQLGARTIGVREKKGADLYYWETPEFLYEMHLYTAEGNDVGWQDLFATIAEIEVDAGL
jgi:hypothetical protein